MKWEPTTQNIAWFKDRAQEGNLTLAPPYQRRPVWHLKQRCYLVDSILTGCLIPESYIRRITTSKGSSAFSVVDGQQRIRTVLTFLGLDRSDAEDNTFALTEFDGDNGAPWYGLTFEELTDEQKTTFYDYTFTVRFVVTNNEQDVRDMFVRLNRFLSPLKPQEIRKARFTGPFVRLAAELADDPYYAKQGIVTPGTIRRMGDIEFVSELLASAIYGPQDGSSRSIDTLCEEFEVYKDEIPDQARVKKRYEHSIEIIQNALPDLPGRWANKHDFYGLFTAICHFLREDAAFNGHHAELATALGAFSSQVDNFIENDEAKVSRAAKNYAKAVQKGPSSKARRGTRHQELTQILQPFFSKR